MSLARSEAPPKKLSVSRSNAVDELRFRNVTDNQDVLTFFTGQGSGAVNMAVGQPSAAGGIASGSSILRLRAQTSTVNGYAVARNPSTIDGYNQTTFTTQTLTNPRLGGFLQVGDYSDEGGVTRTITLPTQAEVISYMPGNGQVGYSYIAQAATNVADQLDINGSDLNVRVNQGGATGTALYLVVYDADVALTVSVSIFQIA